MVAIVLVVQAIAVSQSNFDEVVVAVGVANRATTTRGNFRDDLFRGSYYRMGVHPSIIFQMNKIFELGIHGSFLKLSYNEPLFDLEIDKISQ